MAVAGLEGSENMDYIENWRKRILKTGRDRPKFALDNEK